MNPRKPANKKARNAGISLEPELIAMSNVYAQSIGLRSITPLVRQLLTRELQKAAKFFKTESGASQKKAAASVSAGKAKVKKAVKAVKGGKAKAKRK